MDLLVTRELRQFLLKLALVVVLATTGATTIAVSVVSSQADQQNTELVQHIDQNGETTVNASKAIVCVLNISPNDRNPHGNVLNCLRRYGFEPGELP